MEGKISVLTGALKKAALAAVDGLTIDVQLGSMTLKFKTVTRDGRVNLNFLIEPAVVEEMPGASEDD